MKEAVRNGRGSRRALGLICGLAVAGFAEPAAAQYCRSLVRFTTPLGTFDVSLLDHDAPVTVANFLHYVDAGRYSGMFMHRMVQGFVLQGGGYTYTNSNGFGVIQAFAPIPNEFSLAHGNVARTVAMAKGIGPDSATSQFFINFVDNSANLNNQNGGYTVFGEVTAGWPVVLAIQALFTNNFSTLNPALTQVPVRGPGSISEAVLVGSQIQVISRCSCYADCDGSSTSPILNVMDFQCFLSAYAAGQPWANCDGSTTPPVLTPNDFVCFLNAYAAGCS